MALPAHLNSWQMGFVLKLNTITLAPLQWKLGKTGRELGWCSHKDLPSSNRTKLLDSLIKLTTISRYAKTSTGTTVIRSFHPQEPQIGFCTHRDFSSMGITTPRSRHRTKEPADARAALMARVSPGRFLNLNIKVSGSRSPSSRRRSQSSNYTFSVAPLPPLLPNLGRSAFLLDQSLFSPDGTLVRAAQHARASESAMHDSDSMSEVEWERVLPLRRTIHLVDSWRQSCAYALKPDCDMPPYEEQLERMALDPEEDASMMFRCAQVADEMFSDFICMEED